MYCRSKVCQVLWSQNTFIRTPSHTFKSLKKLPTFKSFIMSSFDCESCNCFSSFSILFSKLRVSSKHFFWELHFDSHFLQCFDQIVVCISWDPVLNAVPKMIYIHDSGLSIHNDFNRDLHWVIPLSMDDFCQCLCCQFFTQLYNNIWLKKSCGAKKKVGPF